MAKLNAPLFSFKASGKLANALVYFGWKGLNVVRSYVVPANPKTAAQTTHRAYLTACVAKIHAALARATNPLDERDKTAYSLLGSTRPSPRTWFNEICKLWLDCEVAGDIPCLYSNGVESNKAVVSINITLSLNERLASQLAAGKFYFGTSKTSLVHTEDATIVAGDFACIDNVDLSAFLTPGIKYFWQFRPDVADPCEGANSGIYYFVAE